MNQDQRINSENQVKYNLEQVLISSRKKGELESLNSECPDHSHAWSGSWNRPMKIDEKTQHPFTIARMTDHNVKGSDSP